MKESASPNAPDSGPNFAGKNPAVIRQILTFLSVVGPKGINGAATLAINILLLRVLGAEELAKVSLCIAGILLADAIVGSAIDMGTMRLGSATSSAESHAVQKHAIYLKLIACGIAFACVYLFGSQIWLALTREANGGPLLLLSCTAGTGMLLLRSAQIHAQIEGRFVTYGLFDLVHSCLRFGGVAVLMSLGNVSPRNILVCFSVAPFPVIAYWFFAKGRDLVRIPWPDFGELKALCVYVRWFLLTFALGSVISRMDLFLVSRWSSLREAGILSAGQIFALVPQMLGLYLAVIIGPKIMPHLKHGTFWAYFRRTQALILTAVAVFYICFEVAWGLGSGLILPDKYIQSAQIIQILIPGALAGLATFPLTLAFIMFTRPRFLFILDCVSLPVLSAVYFFAISKYGAAGAAMTTAGANVLRASVAQWMAWKWARATRRTSEPALGEGYSPMQLTAEQV